MSKSRRTSVYLQGGEATPAAAPKPAPAAGGPPPPPPPGPPPPPPPAVDEGSAGPGSDAKAALFADINRGFAVTAGKFYIVRGNNCGKYIFVNIAKTVKV